MKNPEPLLERQLNNETGGILRITDLWRNSFTEEIQVIDGEMMETQVIEDDTNILRFIEGQELYNRKIDLEEVYL